MNLAELTHIVFNTSQISKTADFWENILGLKNCTNSKNLLQYKISKFLLMFRYSEKCPADYSQTIAHLGIEFLSKAEVDTQYEKLKKKFNLNISKPIGGLKQGPYRFYIKDPNGITLEFETWEGCSDP